MGQMVATVMQTAGVAVVCEPLVGIVVPLFRHSMLVGDAMASIAGQTAASACVAVVVGDGCPYRDSDEHVQAIRAARPDLIHYVMRPNGGLSAARNTGIAYLLTKFPSIQAIYFLDADNLLHPRAIETAYAKLMEQAEAMPIAVDADRCARGVARGMQDVDAREINGWVYPNIDMFGLRRNFDYTGPYSLLRHIYYNICEAGSLVHRRVFEAGIRFDESMRRGYEDWEFWLNAAEHGFRGVHHPHFGFGYRNRAESMLTHAKQHDESIRDYVRAKHGTLLHRDSILALQEREAPRHALVFLDTGKVMVGFGAAEPVVMPQAAFDTLFWRNIVLPGSQHVPPFFLFMKQAVFDELTRGGIMPWIVYNSEILLAANNIACHELEAAPGSFFAQRAGTEPRRCAVLAIKRDLLVKIIADSDSTWLERVASPDPGMHVVTRTLVLPRPPAVDAGTSGAVLAGFVFCVMDWRESRFRQAAAQRWVWREISVPPPHDLFLDVQRDLGGQVLYPGSRHAGRSAGFVLPMAGFGGVERVACNVAQQLAADGWSTHLFVLGGSEIHLPEEFANTFSSVNFLDDTTAGTWNENNLYQGTSIAAGNDPGPVRRLAAALGWLDLVINYHSSDLNAAAGPLRRNGTIMVTHLHLLDHSPFGRSVGHPILALAYEHTYDMVLCCSRQLRGWLHAAGVPDDKLILVPNAPGHPVGRIAREEILASRSMPRPGGLHVLSLGRLDGQKGIHRVADVIERTRQPAQDIDWRVVGSAVIDGPKLPPVLENIVEPAIYRTDQLTALFAWADVMVLLSEFEGVPLSILEAQRLGVVVIATDVGAVSEIIESGVNGLLVSRDTAVDDTVELLTLLSQFPNVRSAIARAAANVPEWPDTCGEFLRWLNEACPAAAWRSVRQNRS